MPVNLRTLDDDPDESSADVFEDESSGDCRYDSEMDDYNGCDCRECREERGEYNGYSSSGGSLYDLFQRNPRFQFIGEGPLYFGMELEVTSGYAGGKVAQEHIGDMGWLKADCSVEGFELCTHPMSFEVWMQQFPWDMLPALREAGCRSIANSNGMHIHVSRTGFSSFAHQYRWMKLFYRNQEHIQRLAGRENSGWGDFQNSDDIYYRRRGMTNREYLGVQKLQFDHLRIRKAQVAAGPRADFVRQEMYRKGLRDIGSRYNAINTLPRDTFEIRAFASTLDRRKAKARVQLAHSSVEYTRDMTTRQTVEGGWDWANFTKYVQERDGMYPQLARTVAG